MPSVFLSPSTQEYNEYVTGGNEEYYTNQIADAMEPYLRAAGIQFTRNDPSKLVGNSVRMSNAGDYDLHLAIHTNASPQQLAGQIQGIDVFYYPGSSRGQAAAELIAGNLESIYPYPELVGATPTTALYELNHTIAPAVLAEIGYHDNYEDAQWITDNVERIAQNLSYSLTEYFGIPFVFPE